MGISGQEPWDEAVTGIPLEFLLAAIDEPPSDATISHRGCIPDSAMRRS